jgi:putative membrane protein
MKRIQITTGLAIAALALTSTTWAAEQQQTSSRQSQPMNMQQQQRGQPATSSLDRSDQQFLQTAASANSAEIQMGKIAQQNSSDPRIRQIGSDLVKDHTKANQELQHLAASKGLSLTFQPTSGQQREIQSLQQKRGDDFNKAFLNRNVKDHQKTIALFQKQSQKGQDPDVKAWANKMLPGLNEHLNMANNPQAIGERTTQGQKAETGAATETQPQTSPTTHRHRKHTRSHHKHHMGTSSSSSRSGTTGGAEKQSSGSVAPTEQSQPAASPSGSER